MTGNDKNRLSMKARRAETRTSCAANVRMRQIEVLFALDTENKPKYGKRKMQRMEGQRHATRPPFLPCHSLGAPLLSARALQVLCVPFNSMAVSVPSCLRDVFLFQKDAITRQIDRSHSG